MSKQPKKTRKVPSKTPKKKIEKPKKVRKAIPEKKSKIVKKIEKKIEKPIVKKIIPTATISRSLRHITKICNGKGFSRTELLSIDLDANKARRLGLRVDSRRTTKWDKNIEALKNWYTIPNVAAKKVKKLRLKIQK